MSILTKDNWSYLKPMKELTHLHLASTAAYELVSVAGTAAHFKSAIDKLIEVNPPKVRINRLQFAKLSC